MLLGVDVRPETARTVPEGALGLSQPAAPLSPEETNAVIPCDAACAHKAFQKALPVEVSALSHRLKLVLMTLAMLLLTMYCAERSTPSLPPGMEAETTNLMVAFLATAPDHSTSRSASVSSFPPRSPGSAPFTIITGSLAGRPKKVRKYCTSAMLMLVRPTMAIVWPVPSIPAVYSGFKL